MNKLDIFQEIFGEVYEFGWWNMEIIQTDADTWFTSREFQEGLCVHGALLELEAPDLHAMNVQVEVTCQTLQNLAHSIMANARVSDKYIHFTIMYTTNHIFPFIPIKHLVNYEDELTNPKTWKLAENLQYQTHVLYCVYLLYERQLHMLTQRS